MCKRDKIALNKLQTLSFPMKTVKCSYVHLSHPRKKEMEREKVVSLLPFEFPNYEI